MRLWPRRDGADGYRRALDSMRNLMATLDELPDLMPPVPDLGETDVLALGKARVLDESHPCLRCGELAVTTMISRHSKTDYRGWLDLCQPCVTLLWVLVKEGEVGAG